MCIQENLNEIKRENEVLKPEINHLKSRMESMEKSYRRKNVIFSGINCSNISAAKSKIMSICTSDLKVTVFIVRIIPLRKNSDYLVELETTQQAIDIFSNSGKLKNTGIWVQYDYTPEERTQRYKLRQLKRDIQKVDKVPNIKFKNTSLIINEFRYFWCNGNIMAQNDGEVQKLVDLLAKCNITTYNVVTRKQSVQEASRLNNVQN